MQRAVLVTLSGLVFLLACGREAPQSGGAEVGREPLPPLPSSSPPAPITAPPPPPPAPPKPRFTRIEVPPTRGDLLPMLREEAERAKEKGLIPVVYFHASWCPPCNLFDKSQDAPEIVAALDGVYLVRLDLDDWHDKLKGTGYEPKKIPAFYLAAADGKPTGKMIDGDKWGKTATAALMGQALGDLLAPAKAAK